MGHWEVLPGRVRSGANGLAIISRNQHLRDVLPPSFRNFFVNCLLDLITVKQAGRLSGRFLGFITVDLKTSKTPVQVLNKFERESNNWPEKSTGAFMRTSGSLRFLILASSIIRVLLVLQRIAIDSSFKRKIQTYFKRP